MKREAWEIARARPRAEWRPPRLYASLNRRGEIAMNELAFNQIKAPANVTLLWDARRRRIGVKFPVTADDHCFPVRRYGRGRRMRIVRAARMMKQFGIAVERTLVFENVDIETWRGEPMLVLNLEQGHVRKRAVGNTDSSTVADHASSRLKVALYS